MMKFFPESQMVPVSFYDPSGWWRGNAEVHVAAGTALPPGCTADMFIPLEEGQTGQYNPESGAWTNHDDNTGTPYWTAGGIRGEINTPDGTIPTGCTGISPPDHDPENQFVVFEHGAWQVLDSHLGKSFWDGNQVEYIVTDPRWECPAGHTLEPPPTPQDGHGLKLINGIWEELPDQRGLKIWNRFTGEERTLKEVGEVWDDQWTDTPPPDPFYHIHDGSHWVVDEPTLAAERRRVRDGKITGIYTPAEQQLSRWIDMAEGNPTPLAHYKAQRTAWHAWANALCNLPDQPGWPWPEGDAPWPEQPSKPMEYTP